MSKKVGGGVRKEPALRLDTHGRGTEPYGWRTFHDVQHAERHSTGSRFCVLSYNILGQSKVKLNYPYCKPGALKWRYRREILLREIKSFNADVVMLQELDNYSDFWRGKMGELGYDSVFKKKTHEKYEDGVATFYKRTRYQLFQSSEIEFNDATSLLGDANDKARAMTDDVALILGLQPWEDSTDPSAICVVNAHLQAGGPGMSKTRLTQSRFLIQEMEKFNATFAMPTIIGGCLNVAPESDIYHIFRTGCLPERPKPPAPPDPPSVSEPNRSMVCLQWKEPFIPSDSEIVAYSITRRAGGNTTMGFAFEFRVAVGDTSGLSDDGKWDYRACETRVDHEGIKHYKCMATGLSSAITYEFKVAAISTAGMGMYSLPSEPITTVKNPALRPRNKNLRHPKKKDRSGLETMRTELAAVATPVELAMLREDVEGTLRGVGGFASAENGSSTGKTPRFEDGQANLRVAVEAMIDERLKGISNRWKGQRLKRRIHSLGLSSVYQTWQEDEAKRKKRAAFSLEKKMPEEPVCTINTEKYSSTVDYIFFSKLTLSVKRRLSIPVVDPEDPRRGDVFDVDPRLPELVEDPNEKKPEYWDDREFIMQPNYDKGVDELVKNENYNGVWKPQLIDNPDKFHHYIPNMHFVSDHFALCAEFEFKLDHLSSIWTLEEDRGSGRKK